MAHPLAQPERGSTPTSDAPRDPLSIPGEVKASIRVLVVDDERTLRESCASVLQMDGYNVTLLGRGEEALDTVKRRKFDIILVDLYMSQVSGLEILQAALGAHKDTNVVVMTGNPSVESSVEALRQGAWDYLPKPFSATHLQVLAGRAAHTVLVVREIFPDTFDRRMEELVGSVQQDPAFLSTALTAGPAYDASRPVVLHLRVPAGTPALYLADVSDAPHEQELLLGRGVRYRVVDTRRIAGRWHVYGEVLEEGAP